MYCFQIPKKVYFKSNSLPVALAELRSVYHSHYAMILTQPEVFHSTQYARILRVLDELNISCSCFFDTDGEIGTVLSKAKAAAALLEPDVVIALGSENSIGIAKAVSAACGCMLAVVPDEKALIAALSARAYIRDSQNGLLYLDNADMLPELVIADPAAMEGLTGMDQKCLTGYLAAALAAYCSDHASPYSEGLAVKAIAMYCSEKDCSHEKLTEAACLAAMAYAVTEGECFPKPGQELYPEKSERLFRQSGAAVTTYPEIMAALEKLKL